jgi:hypothetical protein
MLAFMAFKLNTINYPYKERHTLEEDE